MPQRQVLALLAAFSAALVFAGAGLGSSHGDIGLYMSLAGGSISTATAAFHAVMSGNDTTPPAAK